MRIIIILLSVVITGCDFGKSPPVESTNNKVASSDPITAKVPIIPAIPGERSSVLVDAVWLKNNLDNPDIRVLELGQSREDFGRSHIPTAQYLDWLTDITDPELPERYMILSQQAMEALMSRVGISQDSTVIIYDTLTNRLSARMFWTLRYYGHQDIRILDGGMQAWKLAGFDLVSDITEVAKSEYKIDQINEEYLADKDYIQSRLKNDQFSLVDGRPEDQYTGKISGKVFHSGTEHQRKGHIIGAHNVPWSLNFNEDGTFKSVQDLRFLYETHGVTQDKSIVTYCNEGLHASPPWFVLTELLGYQNVRLYDASMAEWGNTQDTPIVQGKLCM